MRIRRASIAAALAFTAALAACGWRAPPRRTLTTLSITFTRDPSVREPSTPEELAAFLPTSGVRGLDVEVPVTSLRSHKKGINMNLWQDLLADKHPNVTFHLTDYTVTPAESNGASEVYAPAAMSAENLEDIARKHQGIASSAVRALQGGSAGREAGETLRRAARDLHLPAGVCRVT